MRLLNTTTYELCDNPQADGKYAEYAILSHRWRNQEITYATLDSRALHNGTLENASARKVVAACARARQQGLDWIWIDSVCINKGDSAELSEALNTMLKWYRQAKVCYTYLDDVVARATKPDRNTFKSCLPERVARGADSEWFERGWTLQELVTPRHLEFLDREGQFIGTKHDLAGIVSVITGIDAVYLIGKAQVRDTSVATRMSWQSARITTRVQDLAYSMLGLFGVFLNPTYSEGMNAFRRLQYAIIEQSDDESIFAWKSANLPKPFQPKQWSEGEWGLFPPSPACFLDSGMCHVKGPCKRRAGGYKLTQQGLEFPVYIRQAGHLVAADCPVPSRFEFASTLSLTIGQYRPVDLKVVVGTFLRVSLNCWQLCHEGYIFLPAIVVSKDPLILKRLRCDSLWLGKTRNLTASCYWDAISLQPKEDDGV